MSNFDLRRDEAYAKTSDPLTRRLLDLMPRMIAHPAPSGGHEICYQDGDIGGPIACSQGEVRILNALGRMHAGKDCLEIGSYVGWSTAAFLLDNAKTELVTIDNFTEGTGRIRPTPNLATRERFFENMDTLNLMHRVALIEGTTPDILEHVSHAALGAPLDITLEDGPTIATRAQKTWDLVFLDGWHLDGQPLRDVLGVLPFTGQQTILLLHDVWMPDVFMAARHLVLNGWHMQTFPTTNLIAVLYRQEPSWWRKFMRELP